MRRALTLEDTRRALDAFRLMVKRTPREQAEERMRTAKQAMTRAAWAAFEDCQRLRISVIVLALEAARQDLERCDET